jgi:hypothetical protein
MYHFCTPVKEIRLKFDEIPLQEFKMHASFAQCHHPLTNTPIRLMKSLKFTVILLCT